MTNKEPPGIPDGHIQNIKQIVHAAQHGHLGVVATYEKGTNKPAWLVVAKNVNEDGSFEIIPFAKMWGVGEDPFEMFEDPQYEPNSNNDNEINITE